MTSAAQDVAEDRRGIEESPRGGSTFPTAGVAL